MGDILSYAHISVEVLNPKCWEDCEDFAPYLAGQTYATDCFEKRIYTRTWKCRNLSTCKRLSAYLETKGDKR